MAEADVRFTRSSIVESDFVGTPLSDNQADTPCVEPTNPKNGKKHESTRKNDQKPDAGKTTWQQIAGSLNLANTPLTWWTVNAGVGFQVSPVYGAQRMKVVSLASEDVLASDPMPVAMAMAGVTFHARYDASSPDVTWRERLGVFACGVITPNGGIAVGLSVGVARNLAVAVGYAGEWVPTAADGYGIGRNPPEVSIPQFRTGLSRTWFVGLLYAFK